MAERLRAELKAKCENDKSLEPLWAQWLIDERQIGKALQNIGQNFPHYSRHDESHSKQILVNIERILADRIKLLSASDLWLLLEAAYCHDIGMIVTYDDLATDWSSEQFQSYLDRILLQKNHELLDIAQVFKEKDISGFIEEKSLIDLLQQIKWLYADFYRGLHPERSESIVRQPTDTISLNSPRNELIPKRIFSLLGKICSHHGKNFDDVMLLPNKQVGLGNDDIHPRFIACLLRIGDLLDLDNNRFCPVMLRTMGVIPSSSTAHIDKHAAIQNFRMDEDRVEVSAECHLYEGYLATTSWFSWIQDEFQRQMAHWQDIVPRREFGLLPTIGKLDVKLQDYEVLDTSQRPKFGVDQQKAIELLQGAGIYESPAQAVRELLQNAVDATLLRLWLDDSKTNSTNGNCLSSPLHERSIELLSQKPIILSIKRLETIENQEEYATWEITICDQGVGISRHDLRFMQSIGSSYKNLQKQSIIKKMPLWMQPSGVFGIGFQSVFLLTEEVVIKTRSYFASEAFEITFHNPTGEKSGNIFIQKIAEPYKVQTGTCLSFKIRDRAVPTRLSWNTNFPIASWAIENFDPVVDRELPYKIYQLLDGVASFSVASPIPVHVDETEYNIFVPPVAPLSFESFDKTANIALRTTLYRAQSFIQIYYRGQILSDRPPLEFVHIQANLMGEKADSLLTLNRAKLKSEVRFETYDKIISSAAEAMTSKQLNKEEQLYFSAFLRFYGLDAQYSSWTNLWRGIKVTTEFSLDEVLKGSTVHLEPYSNPILRFSLTASTHGPENKPSLEICRQGNDALLITYDQDGLRHDSVVNLLLRELVEQYQYVGYQYLPGRERTVGTGAIITFSTSFLEPFSFEVLEDELSALQRGSRTVRFSMPCLSKYEELAYKDTSNTFLVTDLFSYNFKQPRMIFPFALKPGIGPGIFRMHRGEGWTNTVEETVEWTYKNRQNTSMTKNQIRAIYATFVEELSKSFDSSEDTGGSEAGSLDTQPLEEQSTAIQTNDHDVIINPLDLNYNDLEGEKVICPACNEFQFKSWPKGWELHFNGRRCNHAEGLTINEFMDTHPHIFPHNDSTEEG